MKRLCKICGTGHDTTEEAIKCYKVRKKKIKGILVI